MMSLSCLAVSLSRLAAHLLPRQSVTSAAQLCLEYSYLGWDPWLADLRRQWTSLDTVWLEAERRSQVTLYRDAVAEYIHKLLDDVAAKAKEVEESLRRDILAKEAEVQELRSRLATKET